MRPVILHPKARDAIRRFPKEVRVRLGKGMFRLQMGEQIGMPESRPMPVVAAGVSELRVRGADGTYRAFYYTASRRKGASFFMPSSRKRSEPRHWRLAWLRSG